MYLNPAQVKLALIWRESKKKGIKGQRVHATLDLRWSKRKQTPALLHYTGLLMPHCAANGNNGVFRSLEKNVQSSAKTWGP